MSKLYTGGNMPLVPQQAVLFGIGNSMESAMTQIEKQMDELPDVRIISISVAAGSLHTFHLAAVVETI